MPKTKPSVDTLGQLLLEKRGQKGLRAAAREIGISPATLSRVENGHLPDLENFRRICTWLDVDPNRILGFRPPSRARENEIRATVHFRKPSTTSPETAAALAKMILHVQRALAVRDRE